MEQKVLVIGNGGHSKVIQSALESIQFVDFLVLENESDHSDRAYKGWEMIIAVGDNSQRKKISKKLKTKSSSLIAINSNVDSDTHIGDGTVVLQGAAVQRDTTVGKHCIINTNASVDHDCKIGDFVHIAPNSTLCGNVTVGDNTLIGAGAVVIPGVTIGKDCIVGAGTVVLKDVDSGLTVVGKHG